MWSCLNNPSRIALAAGAALGAASALVEFPWLGRGQESLSSNEAQTCCEPGARPAIESRFGMLHFQPLFPIPTWLGTMCRPGPGSEEHAPSCGGTSAAAALGSQPMNGRAVPCLLGGHPGALLLHRHVPTEVHVPWGPEAQ